MTAKRIGSNQDFQGNQALNLVFHILSGAPSAPFIGQAYYNSSLKVGFIWNSTAWRPMDAAALVDGSVPIAALTTNPLLRANHQGTQLASTISDLAATVKAYTLDSFAVPVASISFGGQRITNLGNGVGAQDAVTLSQANSLIAAAVAGQTAIKNPARVYADTNIALTGLQTVSGVALAVGDRALVGAQTAASQNGLYVVAAGAWQLALDANVAADWVEGTEILDAEGSYSGSIFRQVTTSPTLTNLTFVQTAKINTYTADGVTLSLTGTQFAVRFGAGLSTASGVLAVDTGIVGRKVVGTITHDGATLNFNVTHNLNNTAPVVGVRDAGGSRWDIADQATSASVVQIQYDMAQPNGTVHTVTIIG